MTNRINEIQRRLKTGHVTKSDIEWLLERVVTLETEVTNLEWKLERLQRAINNSQMGNNDETA